ncbi:MAG: hypothetical protein LBE61_09590 [Burkholderiaceae bacterium]|jgi:hypothetical protein|nr:hypothetical protein [Burkholderiaceae bacterium]
MSDRELLMKAAKSVGKELDLDRFDDEMGFIILGISRWWNPLTNDGDALRLAAALKIDLEWQSTGPFPETRVEAYQRNQEGSWFCADEAEDDYRRAITRVAAAIQEAKETCDA